MFLQLLGILTYGIGDLWTTKIFLNKGLKEGNPFMAFILKISGFKGMIISKIIIISLVLIYYPDVTIILILVGLYAIIWNLNIINKYNKIKRIRRK